MVSEMLGLALPGSAMLPAVYSQRLALARRSGETVLRILRGRRAAAAGPRHAEEHRERLRRRRRDRRFDQCRTAPARDRARGRHPLHARRRRGGLPAHAAASAICSRAGASSRVTCTMPAACRGAHALLDGGYLHGDALTLSGRTLAETHAATPGPGRRASCADGEPHHTERRRGGAQGQPLPRRRADQDRGLKELGSQARRVSSSARRSAPRPFAGATTAPATSSSSATKAPRAGPACARCSA